MKKVENKKLANNDLKQNENLVCPIPKERNPFIYLFFVIILFLLGLALVFYFYYLKTSASFPRIINYQGRLTNSSGSPVADSSYNLSFKIFNTDTDGTALWTETRCKGDYTDPANPTCSGTGTDNRIPLAKGLFSTLLGSINTFGSLNFNQDLYLEIDVGGSDSTPSWVTLTPRKHLGSSISAFEATQLGGKDESQFATLAEEEIITAPWRFNTNSTDPGIIINQSGTGNGLTVNGTTLFMSLDVEKITNGTFDSTSNWVFGTGWALDTTNNEADHASGTAVLEQDVGSVGGETYYLTFDIKNRTAGSITPSVGGATGTSISTNGYKTQTITATNTNTLQFIPSTDFDGSIDNVSVKKINQGGNMYVMGNVGIGTTSPSSPLTIATADPSEKLIDTTNGSYTKLTKSNISNSAVRYNQIDVFSGGTGDIDANTVLMLHMNGVDTPTTFMDSSASGHNIIANGDAQLQAPVKKFGDAAAYFDGTGDYLTIPNSPDFNFGTADWTIDFQLQIINYGLFGYSAVIAPNWNMTDDTTKFPTIYYSNYSGGDISVGVSVNLSHNFLFAGLYADGNFHHVAVVRNGIYMHVYVDGTESTSGAWDITGTDFVNDSGVIIGDALEAPYHFYVNGYIDELRVSKGVARWTIDFTPLDREYTVGTISTPADTIVWKSENSFVNDEKGIQIFGDSAGRSILQGATIHFNIGASEKIVVDGNGNVGIGTASPEALLHLAGVDPEIRLTDTGNGEYARLTKSDTDNLAAMKNRVLVASPGASDGALKMTSNSGYLKLGGDTYMLNNPTDWSISAWINLNDYDTGGTPTLIGFDFNGIPVGLSIWVGHIFLIYNNRIKAYTSLQLDQNTKYHIVLTSSGNSTFKIYVNSLESDVGPNDQNWGQILQYNYLNLGVNGQKSPATFDEVALYNTTLSQSDINTLYGGGTGYVHTGSESGLADLWHFDDGTGATAVDSKGSFNGTINGTTTWVSGLISQGSAPAPEEINVWESKNSAIAGENGIQIFGDSAGRSILQGATIHFNIGAAEKIIVDENGRLGIGTTTPDSALHVIGGVCIEGTDSGCAQSAGNLKVGGTIDSVGGFKVNSVTGLSSQTITVGVDGGGTCTITITGGIVTATTCS